VIHFFTLNFYIYSLKKSKNETFTNLSMALYDLPDGDHWSSITDQSSETSGLDLVDHGNCHACAGCSAFLL
jgi:hypothetical protein